MDWAFILRISQIVLVSPKERILKAMKVRGPVIFAIRNEDANYYTGKNKGEKRVSDEFYWKMKKWACSFL